MSENTIKLYGNKVYGVTVSSYGLKNGYLDYRTLAELVGDCILNNAIWSAGYPEDWELISGEDSFGLDSDGRECNLYSEDCVDIVQYEIYQHYIISEYGAKFLARHTDEIVYYNAELDVYLWGVTHFETSWDYVLTNIKLVNGDDQ